MSHDRPRLGARDPRTAPLPFVGPGARRLLDLIARAEGTTGEPVTRRGYVSDYDVTFNYGRSEPPGRTRRLSEMTLDEARELQKGMRGSSAIGRYQIMRGTMRGLAARHGLAGPELFDAQLQDGLARSLMAEKGYDAYGRGAKTADEVMDGLAAIWASLPDGSGASKWTYAGRPQPVGTTRAELRGTLEAAGREDFGAPPERGWERNT